MPNRMRLLDLTFIGDDRPMTSVSFSPGVTVIHGPSDTGKSFVSDAISYMLGGKSLKQIGELKGYRYILLGLEVDGQKLTLRRGITGGSLGLFRGDAVDPWAPVSDGTLPWKHSSNPKNLSTFLLKSIGLAGRRIRKNVNNETIDMSFRYVTHLCVIGEEKIQSERSPVIHNPMLKTADKSAFKVLLQGDDDSLLEKVIPSAVVNATAKLRQEVIDDLIEQTQREISASAPPADAIKVLADLNRGLQDNSATIDELVSTRDALSSRRLSLKRQLAQVDVNLSETSALKARFDLLLEQYDVDLRRLDFLQEASDIVGRLEAVQCPLCGSEPMHQVHSRADADSAAAYRESVEVEAHKTLRLRSDLEETLHGVANFGSDLRGRKDDLATRVVSVSEELVTIDAKLRPAKESIGRTLALRSSIEKVLILEGQIASLVHRRAQYLDEAIVEVAEPQSPLDSTAVMELSRLIVSRLGAWGVPNSSSATFSAVLQDVMLEGQERGAHGKGVRSLLHAAFTLSLAQYCFDNGLPHPGFVVLDSPLVAYRPPDSKNPKGPSATEEGLGVGIVEAFYRDIQDNFDGQVIILENTSPENFLHSAAGNIQFSKSDGDDRYGLFPKRR
jgi:hypothetical protein